MSSDSAGGKRLSPFREVPRWQLVAFVVAVIVVIVVLLTKPLWESDTGTGGPSTGTLPTTHRLVPWMVFGTADGGRSVLVLPLGTGDICTSWRAKLDAAPTGGPIRITVTSTRVGCGRVPSTPITPSPSLVTLGGDLGGRRITGPLMQPLAARAGSLQSYARRARTRIAVPGVLGLTVGDAGVLARAFGFSAVGRKGISASAVVVAQRPAPDALRQYATPGRVRLVTALDAP